MSFLPLVPACRRLREAAKAHAAGELAQADYRALRRRTIEELGARFDAADGSAQLPIAGLSWPGETTARRAGQQPRAFESQGHGLGVEPLKMVEDPAKTDGSWFNSTFLLILLTLVLLVASASALAQTVEIPAVRDRAANPDQALVIAIEALQINYLDAMPELDKLAVDAKVMEWLEQARAASQPTAPHGFTEAELADIAQLMARLGVHTSEGLDESAAEAINTLTRRQQQRRGVSIAQLEQIAQQLQQYLREQGWLVASAYLPAQELIDGRVLLNVLPGRLAEVRATSQTTLVRSAQASLEPLLNQPLRAPALEAFMFRLNSLPGIRAQGSLEAGDDIGTTRLNLQLDQQRRVASRFRFDDLGDRRSARFRLEGALDVFNPLQRGDLLSLAIEQRLDRNSGTRGSLNYQLPVGKLGNAVSFGASINGFSVERLLGLSGSGDIDGQGATIRAGYDRVLLGTRHQSLDTGIDVAWQNLELGDAAQQLWWVAPRIGGHWVLPDNQWVFRGQASLTVGRITSGTFTEQTDGFASLESRVSAWHPVGNQSVRLSLNTQLGSDDLPDSLKRTLGGVARVRGLRPGSFSADRSVAAGVEVTATPDLLRRFGELLLFGNWARGQRSLLGLETSARSWEVGVGFRLRSTAHLSGEVRFALPFGQEGLEADDDDPRLLFRLQYRP